MCRDRDFDLKHALPQNVDAPVQDLEIETLFEAITAGDRLIHEIARIAALTGAKVKLEEISYHQRALDDALRNPAVVRNEYEHAGEAIEREKSSTLASFVTLTPLVE
ncbi:hypothetical protein IVB18_15590 [Bradyrhizobium sp. 186]|uniref:hypothetical protein n=1 Tax=Bradyrhizobium sp. 186 TaxID=2782654 RepID=UPI0020008102|nr:hypothetical protein [Bradyrhizobium sp. 186]UPK38535.1 hypothetical protein IVB18_15590 [Bradyrhizobium sp. 186]